MRNKAIHTKHINPNNISKFGYRTHFFLDLEITAPDEATGLYEFGVFSGKSIIELLNVFNQTNKLITDVYGFDSFQGIPKCDKEPLWFAVWGQGEFNSCDYLGVDDPLIACASIKKEIEEFSKGRQEIFLYPGYFSESLSAIDASILKPAKLVDIDVDIYSSAKEALLFMCKNKLLRKGTIINYDDWGSPGNETYSSGESRAHKEICDEFNIECELVRQNPGSRAYKIISC